MENNIATNILGFLVECMVFYGVFRYGKYRQYKEDNKIIKRLKNELKEKTSENQ